MEINASSISNIKQAQIQSEVSKEDMDSIRENSVKMTEPTESVLAPSHTTPREIKETFSDWLKEIHENNKEIHITPRELLTAFGYIKRSTGNLVRINQALDDNKLETNPDYTDSWIDGEIILKHKKRARTRKESDPIQRIKLLSAANRQPISIPRDAKLKEAITLMMLHNYSQLPVMNTPRQLIGVITWETIGYGITNGSNSEDAKDYIKKEVVVLDYEMPILDAVSRIIDNEFSLVKKSDNTISGIVTIADISSQFLNVTEPFLLLEQIENHIRQILNGKFLVDDLIKLCKIDETDQEIEFIDDLTFGDYVRIIENPNHWDRLSISIERSHFIKQLDKVREIRNDIMHFDPEGITKEQKEDLLKMSKFLMELRKFI